MGFEGCSAHLQLFRRIIIDFKKDKDVLPEVKIPGKIEVQENFPFIY